jgi:pimeloyl-ACP methyl ester carboxylesterase
MSSARSTPLAPGPHVVRVSGISQRYHVAGTGPVCLVHPGGPGVGWEYLRMAALERILTLVYLEPVGTGESGRLPDPQDYRLDTYVRCLHGVIDHLGLPRVSLLGHSHGGFVAQRYALEHPDKIARLVLYATSPVAGPDFWADALENVRQFAVRNAPRPEAAQIAAAFGAASDQKDSGHPGGHPDSDQPDSDQPDSDDRSVGFQLVFPAYFADYWAREAEFAPLRARLRAWRGPTRSAEPAPLDVREALRDLTIPVAIIAGAHDIVCGPRWAGMLHEALPGSRLRILPESGHFPHLEQPGEFTAAVAEFLTASEKINRRQGHHE